MKKFRYPLAIILVGVVMVIGLYLFLNRGESYKPAEVNYAAGEQETDHLKDVMISYLGYPTFSGGNFFEQITGIKATVERINMDERNLYLSIPISQYTEEIVTVLAYDPEQVEFGRTPAGHFAIDAKEERKSIELGPYKYSGLDTYFFRVPIKQWRFNPAQAISFPFGELTYDVTPNELDAFFSNSSIYGGYLNVDYGFLDGREADFANHGAFVAKKEASLQRLVAKLTEPGDSMETKIQKLLNFVTKEIEYNWKEVYHDVETLKRPNEVLMTGTSDCSGKVILFASLLEQIDADYVLIYTGKGEYLSHIAVAVSGSFPRTNEHSFGLGGRDYFIAETTAEGFQIGNSVLVDPLISAGSLLFWQRPRDKSAITDGRSGTPLKFI